MGKFIHTRNGEIIIIDNSGNQSTYDATWWMANEEKSYALPTDAIEQYYYQTIERQWLLNTGIPVMGTIPWTDGDGYISNKATYDADWFLYNTAPTLSAAKTYQINLLTAYFNNFKNNSNVVYLGTTFSSNTSKRNQWKEQLEYANRNTLLLSGQYIRDVANIENIMDIATFNEFIDEIDEFYWILQEVYDDHFDAINAISTTVADVLSYDFTTNWPIVPFDNSLSFAASYSSTIDADFALGTATGTAIGGAAILSNWLDLAHSDARYVNYSATSNADSPQTGSIIAEIKLNYSGAPVADKVFISESKADADSTNLIQLTHKITTGNLQLDIRSSTDTLIASINFGAWTPVSGTIYKFSIHYDLTAGNNWLKINDIQFGTTDTTTGTRDASIGLLRVGSGYNSGSAELSNFSIRNLHISSK